MRKTTFILSILATSLSMAQNAPIDFESADSGANWTWTVFENDTNPPLEIIANPDPTGINTSATVAKFTALQTGMPFAGVESMHGADIGTFTLTSDNAFVTIKVWKSVISDVGIKFATLPGASTGEIKIPNTLVEEWEELTFDFTGVLDDPSSTDIDQIIIFPDFIARSSDQVILFDDISFSDGVLGVVDNKELSFKMYPNPVKDFWNIESNDVIQTVKLYNIVGQLIFSENINHNKSQLDFSSFRTGIYLAEIKTLLGEKKLKIVIE